MLTLDDREEAEWRALKAAKIGPTGEEYPSILVFVGTMLTAILAPVLFGKPVLVESAGVIGLAAGAFHFIHLKMRSSAYYKALMKVKREMDVEGKNPW